MTKYNSSRIQQDMRFLNIRTLLEMVDTGRLDVYPIFGAMPVLPIISRSQIIESLILGLPVETIWAEKNALGRTQLLSGFEIISTVRAFAEGQLALRGLRVLKHLEGLSFDQIDYVEKRHFEQMEVNFNAISYDSNPLLKCMLIEKINKERQGSNSAQLARNIIFPTSAAMTLDLAALCLNQHDFSGVHVEKNKNRILLRMQTDIFYGLLIKYVKSNGRVIAHRPGLESYSFSRSHTLEYSSSPEISPSDDVDYAVTKLAMMLEIGNFEVERMLDDMKNMIQNLLNVNTFYTHTVGQNHRPSSVKLKQGDFSLLDCLYAEMTGMSPPLRFNRYMSISDFAGII
ncbi:hypothetical protein [Enterobacter mori]|uniref:hypothetical protein n=1 Tax=Enterobacter mori TaxID=539813 RepID=UPI0029314421|nr:hypothetical protein [Enterobacter mori]